MFDTRVGNFLVVRPPFAQGADASALRPVYQQADFVAFTTLALCFDGSRASFRVSTEEQARLELEAALAPLQVTWLMLEHADQVVEIPLETQAGLKGAPTGADYEAVTNRVPADAALVGTPGYAVAFTTADCLPVILASKSCNMIAGIHAGWRGIASGVIENCCSRFSTRAGGSMPADTQAWIGPSIAAKDYEIDEHTRSELLKSPQVSSVHFSSTIPGHYLADLQAMAQAKLQIQGVPFDSIAIQQGSTYHSPHFHSARRDGERSGRMATVVGITGRKETARSVSFASYKTEDTPLSCPILISAIP